MYWKVNNLKLCLDIYIIFLVSKLSLIFHGDKYDNYNSAQKRKNKVSDRLHWETMSWVLNNVQIF